MALHAGEGGRLTGQPTAMAGDTLRVIMDMGKFQGVMAATTPTGCFITTGRLLADTVCSTSPLTLLHSSANHSMEATLQAAHEGMLRLAFSCGILGLTTWHVCSSRNCTELWANVSNLSTSLCSLDQCQIMSTSRKRCTKAAYNDAHLQCKRCKATATEQNKLWHCKVE